MRITDLDAELVLLATPEQHDVIVGRHTLRCLVLRYAVRRLRKAGNPRWLEHQVERDIRQKVGNPLVLIAILGIIINLLWQWWLARKKDRAVLTDLLADADRLEASAPTEGEPPCV
jgi:hypothetical protein